MHIRYSCLLLALLAVQDIVAQPQSTPNSQQLVRRSFTTSQDSMTNGAGPVAPGASNPVGNGETGSLTGGNPPEESCTEDGEPQPAAPPNGDSSNMAPEMGASLTGDDCTDPKSELTDNTTGNNPETCQEQSQTMGAPAAANLQQEPSMGQEPNAAGDCTDPQAQTGASYDQLQPNPAPQDLNGNAGDPNSDPCVDGNTGGNQAECPETSQLDNPPAQPLSSDINDPNCDDGSKAPESAPLDSSVTQPDSVQQPISEEGCLDVPSPTSTMPLTQTECAEPTSMGNPPMGSDNLIPDTPAGQPLDSQVPEFAPLDNSITQPEPVQQYTPAVDNLAGNSPMSPPMPPAECPESVTTVTVTETVYQAQPTEAAPVAPLMPQPLDGPQTPESKDIVMPPPVSSPPQETEDCEEVPQETASVTEDCDQPDENNNLGPESSMSNGWADNQSQNFQGTAPPPQNPSPENNSVKTQCIEHTESTNSGENAPLNDSQQPPTDCVDESTPSNDQPLDKSISQPVSDLAPVADVNPENQQTNSQSPAVDNLNNEGSGQPGSATGGEVPCETDDQPLTDVVNDTSNLNQENPSDEECDDNSLAPTAPPNQPLGDQLPESSPLSETSNTVINGDNSGADPCETQSPAADNNNLANPANDAAQLGPSNPETKCVEPGADMGASAGGDNFQATGGMDPSGGAGQGLDPVTFGSNGDVSPVEPSEQTVANLADPSQDQGQMIAYNPNEMAGVQPQGQGQDQPQTPNQTGANGQAGESLNLQSDAYPTASSPTQPQNQATNVGSSTNIYRRSWSYRTANHNYGQH
ncbi:hypothetical protein IWQ62_000730 [Dispira parvispora]|uniref:Uncharacterized protein n=1 Tax=Dispira parvispora TaxID=1520584 RepID=A0A9W8E9U7_9FUNG|nr:hypothetical protein IWQ62_000730 [Dispira parvispora]